MKRFAQSLSVLTVMLCLLTAGPLWAQGKVDINTADVETLKNLKGVGDVKANAIIKYRQMNGRFQSLDDLKSVPGIGEKIVQDNKSNIAIGKGGKAMAKPKSKATTGVKGKADKSMKDAKGKADKSMKGAKDKADKSMKSATEKMKSDKKATTEKAGQGIKAKTNDKAKKEISSGTGKAKKAAGSSSKKAMKKSTDTKAKAKDKAKKEAPKSK